MRAGEPAQFLAARRIVGQELAQPRTSGLPVVGPINGTSSSGHACRPAGARTHFRRIRTRLMRSIAEAVTTTAAPTEYLRPVTDTPTQGISAQRIPPRWDIPVAPLTLNMSCPACVRQGIRPRQRPDHQWDKAIPKSGTSSRLRRRGSTAQRCRRGGGSTRPPDGTDRQSRGPRSGLTQSGKPARLGQARHVGVHQLTAVPCERLVMPSSSSTPNRSER